MPSAEGFAECTISSTRQNYYLPSAWTLPSASHVALGKATLCRVPKSRHSANAPLPSATWAALGKQCHVCHTRPHTPVTTEPPLFFAECLIVGTWQRLSCVPHTTVTPLPRTLRRCEDRYRYDLPSARLGTLGKPFCLALGKDLWMPSAIALVLGIQTPLPSVLFSSRRNNKKNSPMQSKLFS